MSEDAPAIDAAHDLSYYLRPLRRHLRLVAACIALGLVLSVALALAIRPTYTATTKVDDIANARDARSTATNGRNTASVNMDNEAQTLKSLTVATIAQRILRTGTTTAKLKSKISVRVPPNTTILAISCTGHSPKAAALCANAFATAYLQNRAALAKAYLTGNVADINQQLSVLHNALATYRRVLDTAATTSPAYAAAAQKRSQAQTEITTLNNELGTATSGSTQSGTVISSALAGGSSPNQLREIIVLAGLVLGTLLGLVAAPVRDRLDKQVRNPDDLTREGLELIAEIPRPGRGRNAAHRAQSRARTRAEQRLAAVIGAALGSEGGSIYLAELSDTVSQQGFASRLATELGRFGSTTEVVTYGAPLPHTVDTRTLHPDVAPRELEVGAANRADDPDAADVGWPDGDGSASEPAPEAESAPGPEPNTELDGDDDAAAPPDDVSAILQRVQAALARSRYVVLHGTNATVGSEAYILASLSQATALVVEADVTTREELADVVDQVEVTSSELLGALLWRPTAGQPSHRPAADEDPRVPRAAPFDPVR
jgi:capsular polysaccharide biosynthesis protein